MCDFSGKLIAWMDGELADGEAVVVREHLESCAACQSRLASYRGASASFAEYCEAATGSVVAPRARLGVPRWAFAAAAVAAAVALLLFVPRPATKSPAPARESVAANQSADGSLAAVPAAIHSNSVAAVRFSAAPAVDHGPRNVAVIPHRAKRETLPGMPVRADASPVGEPALEIAFSSDAIFPAGAMPEGVSFVGEVTLAADGSAVQMRLQPRLVEFQERTIRP
jgi:anti-sigma factor RsiW